MGDRLIPFVDGYISDILAQFDDHVDETRLAEIAQEVVALNNLHASVNFWEDYKDFCHNEPIWQFTWSWSLEKQDLEDVRSIYKKWQIDLNPMLKLVSL